MLKNNLNKSQYLTFEEIPKTSLDTIHENESVEFSIQEIKMESNLFMRCPKCNEILIKSELDRDLYVCSYCNNHIKIDSMKRIEFIFDKDSVQYLDENMKSLNPIDFPEYSEKTEKLINELKINEAIITGIGNINNIMTCFGVMDSRFIMGSLGSVVGEKLSRIFEKAINLKLPVIVFTTSGGARMQEGILSLLQMAKVSAAVKRHSNAGLLYITVITDPTTGGVTASFASLGDIIIAEPQATIGFAGKRVIEQTIKQKLIGDFQSSEFMLKHGFIDMILHRKNMKNTLYNILKIHNCSNAINIKKAFNLSEEININSKDLPNKNIDPWEKVNIARNKCRPHYIDYINGMIDEFTELHGDRCFMDDDAIVGGIGYLNDIPITIICHARGKSLEENIKRNFGSPYPEGYRKALRLMKQAEKFNRPIICLIDTQGAYCGVAAEERGQGQAIANNLLELSDIKTPVISVVIGEGGSGGALALGVADKVFMLENSIYSVISPEGCASILMKDSSKAYEAAKILKLTAQDLMELNAIDGIINEPVGGADKNVDYMVSAVKNILYNNLLKLLNKDIYDLVNERYIKLRGIGRYTE